MTMAKKDREEYHKYLTRVKKFKDLTRKKAKKEKSGTKMKKTK